MTKQDMVKLVEQAWLDANREFNNIYGPSKQPVPATMTAGCDIFKKHLYACLEGETKIGHVMGYGYVSSLPSKGGDWGFDSTTKHAIQLTAWQARRLVRYYTRLNREVTII